MRVMGDFFLSMESKSLYSSLPKPVRFRVFRNGFRNRWQDLVKQFKKKDRYFFVIANAMIIAPEVVFAVFCLPTLNELSPAITVFWTLLSVAVFYAMYKTSFTDPGYLPRYLDVYGDVTDKILPADVQGQAATLAPATEQGELVTNSVRVSTSQSSAANTDVTPWVMPSNYPSALTAPFNLVPDLKRIILNGSPGTLKYCNTCQTYRSPRASHCGTCDRCVDSLDHHCPWMANCVGRRNYRYFFTFVLTTTALTGYCMAFSIVTLFKVKDSRGISFGEAIGHNVGSLILIVYCVAMGFSLIGLCGFHTFLISLNVTTREHLRLRVDREIYLERHSPVSPGNSSAGVTSQAPSPPIQAPSSRYSRGNVAKNVCFVLLRAQPPSFEFRIKSSLGSLQQSSKTLSAPSSGHLASGSGHNVPDYSHSGLVGGPKECCASSRDAKLATSEVNFTVTEPAMAQVAPMRNGNLDERPRWQSIYNPNEASSEHSSPFVSSAGIGDQNSQRVQGNPVTSGPLVSFPTAQYQATPLLMPTKAEARTKRWKGDSVEFFRDL